MSRERQEGSGDCRTQIKRALNLWKEIIFFYTECGLTQDQDKLIAVSAIAKELQPFIGVEYLAGLWGGDLFPLQLLWYTYITEGVENTVRKPTVYCAPTWSWAYVISYVSFFDIEETNIVQDDGKLFLIQVLECKTQPQKDNPLGLPSGGYLRLKGWL